MGNTWSNREDLFVPTDNVTTHTSKQQHETELLCIKYYKPVGEYDPKSVKELEGMNMMNPITKEPKLLRRETIQYIMKGLSSLPGSYASLDASRPWIIYWMIHALELLGRPPVEMFPNVINTLRRCQHASGGFAGGIGQYAHTAPTYAAVLALATVGSNVALQVINREKVYAFFMRLKHPSGGFMVQDDGEVDTRGLYTVLAVASILNILTPELTQGCAEFVARCQTFEGGIGGEPGNEAHGGYAFCGIAALVILNRLDALDLDALLHWIVTKQMRAEGGFQGRANKLVDSCYSFWQGGVAVLVQRALKAKVSSETNVEDEGLLLFNQLRLQHYVVLCCQHVQGGLVDKPHKPRDHYHTCYSLSGLSLAQHHGGSEMRQLVRESETPDIEPLVFGDEGNLLVETDPVYNVSVTKLNAAKQYFANRGTPSHQQLLSVARGTIPVDEPLD